MRAPSSPSWRAAPLALVLVAVQAMLVSWFAWPAARTAPRHLPVVVTGPPAATTALADRLHSARPGGFDVRTVPDEAAADAALRDRSAYAAFVLSPQGTSVHLASAASPAAAALLTQAAQQLGEGGVPVVDVVSSPADDPRGGGLAAGFLPLLLTSLAYGVVLPFLVRRRTARLLGLLLFAALGGLLSAAILTGLGVLTGTYLAAAGVLALIVLGVSAAVCGLGSVLGAAGLLLGALVTFLFANPISGVTSAPELLPRPWGDIGQLLPPGAGATLLRGSVFFDGSGTASAFFALLGWAVGGLLLTLVGGADLGRSRRAAE